MNDGVEREARRFVEEETQFHLGFLPTEQSHPRTRDFSEVIARDTAAGAARLLSVDLDIPPRAAEVYAGPGFAALEQAIARTAEAGGRVCFSGCGATGRLAIILEKIWRAWWEEAAARAPRRAELYLRRAQASWSIMTGGDRALIRSVENFEDYESFGRRQVRDAGLGAADLLIAISEGGETSSVIGTALEACDRGARVFFLFNNPRDLLVERIERSRRVIERPGIVALDLCTGPMALSGSTRLQATTCEMLVVGAALERACAELLRREAPEGAGTAVAPAPGAGEYAVLFERLVRSLSVGPALAALAAAIELESGVYREGGRVTYLCDEYLLDIISDTTERTPTFMLPPFRRAGDHDSAPSWAFTKDPLRETRAAWRHLLRREPRGIDWQAEDYRLMNAAERIASAPPKLDREEIYAYEIGREEDPSRWEAPGSLLFLVNVGRPPSEAVRRAFEVMGRPYPRRAVLDLATPEASPPSSRESGCHLPLDIVETPLRLFTHLAVKLVFNTLSTATMGKLGRIRGNWMIQVDPTNKKLIDRATRIIAGLAGLSYAEACLELHRTLAGPRPPLGSRADSSVARTLARLGRSRPA